MNIRLQSGLLAALAAPAGYSVRFAPALPEWLRDSSGGATYVVFWAMAAQALRPDLRPSIAAAAALTFTCAVESLQLWHPAWLDALRRTLPGRLVLGSTFAWSDFPPYFLGAGIAWLLLKAMRTQTPRRPPA